MDGGVADTACCTKAVKSAEGRGRSGGGAASSFPAPKETASDNHQPIWPLYAAEVARRHGRSLRRDLHTEILSRTEFLCISRTNYACVPNSQLPTRDDDRTVTSQKPARHSQQTRRLECKLLPPSRIPDGPVT